MRYHKRILSKRQHNFQMVYKKHMHLATSIKKIKHKTHRHVNLPTNSKLKSHRESVPLRISTAGIMLFKNCAFGDYPFSACKI